jgi:hypothetical protein
MLADEIYEKEEVASILKEDFIINIEQMDDYRQNFEDSLFVFKKFNWSLQEIYAIPYGSRQYQLMKIDEYCKTVNNNE